MASGKSNYLITKILNQEFNATAFSFPGTLYMAIWTSTANTTNFPLSVSGSAIQNATAITFPANGGSLNTGTFFAILDVTTLGAGNILYWGSISSTAINPGDTPQVAINGLTVTEA